MEYFAENSGIETSSTNVADGDKGAASTTSIMAVFVFAMSLVALFL